MKTKRPAWTIHDTALSTGAGLSGAILWLMADGIFRLIHVLLLVALVAGSAEAATYYVTPNGAGAMNGTSWDNAGNGATWINAHFLGGDTCILGKGLYLDFRLTVPVNKNSGDRSCIICSTQTSGATFIDPFTGAQPLCSLTAGTVVTSPSWTGPDGNGLYYTPFTLPYQPNEFGANTHNFAGGIFEDDSMMIPYLSLSSWPNGSAMYSHSAGRLYVKPASGAPTGKRYIVSGEQIYDLSSPSDSERQFLSIDGFTIFAHTYGAFTYQTFGADSNFVDHCRISGISSVASGASNEGVVACGGLEVWADYGPGGRDSTYQFNSKYGRVKSCWVYNIMEPGNSRSRACVATTYGLSHFYIDSVRTYRVAGLHSKNRGDEGRSRGNVQRYCIIEASEPPSGMMLEHHVSDSFYCNILVNIDGPVWENSSWDNKGAYFCHNTIYGIISGDYMIFFDATGPQVGPNDTTLFPPNEFKYNIFMDNNASCGDMFVFQQYLGEPVDDDTNCVIDSNIYANVGSGNKFVRNWNSTRLTFAQWQTYSSGQWAQDGGRDLRHDIHSSYNTFTPAFDNPVISNPTWSDFYRTDDTDLVECGHYLNGQWMTWYGAVQPGDEGPTTPHISLSTGTLTFNAVENGSLPASQNFTITNTGGGTLDWAVGDNQTWISESPGSGSDNSHSITVSISTTALTPGTYNATITVSSTNADNSPQTIAVTYNVSSASPTIDLSATNLYFSATENGATPAAQQFTVGNSGGGSLSFSAADGSSWLDITPSSGTDDQIITVSVNTTNLTPGVYNGTITVTDAGATNSPQQVAVQYTINAVGDDTSKRMPYFKR